MSAQQVYCEASLNYSVGETSQPVPVGIADGRQAGLSWPHTGFELARYPLPIDHSWSAADFGRHHRDGIAALAREQSGCDRVLVYPAIVRSPDAVTRIADYGPIHLVHSDFTDDFRSMAQSPERPYSGYIAPLLAEAGLEQADIARAGRVLMLQFWRNIGPQWPDFPLAFCDARSVDRSELLPFTVPEYGGAHLEFETFAVRPPADAAKHRWYTFPGMSAEELVIFRTYDSACAESDEPFWTPHSAFADPNFAAPAPQRHSVEIRALCLFDP